METIVVAGATGNLGRQVVRVLRRRGYAIRALVRSRTTIFPEDVLQIEGDLLVGYPVSAFEGAACVVSCAGAPLTRDDRKPRETFEKVDWDGNRLLIETAEAAGVERFVYVSFHNAHLFMNTEYARAHEKTVGALRQSRLLQSIVRPTGLFSAYLPLVDEAGSKGRVTMVGDGSAQTNPISEEDLAEVIADVVRDQPHEIAVGGPETLARQQIALLACEAAGVSPRVRHLPPWLVEIIARFHAPFRPRVAASLRFLAIFSEVDCVAPSFGERTLKDAMSEVAAGPETTPDTH